MASDLAAQETLDAHGAVTATETSAGPEQEISLKNFAEKRRAYLLNYSEAKKEAARTAAIEVYRGPLEADVSLWSHCAAQWGAGPGFKVRVERIIRDWFEKQTELNQKLEGVMAALWEEAVVRPLERLSDESAGELPEPSFRACCWRWQGRRFHSASQPSRCSACCR